MRNYIYLHLYISTSLGNAAAPFSWFCDTHISVSIGWNYIKINKWDIMRKETDSVLAYNFKMWYCDIVFPPIYIYTHTHVHFILWAEFH